MSTQEIISMNNLKELSASRKYQYTLPQILGIWASVALPMALLAWVVYPALNQGLAPVDSGLLWMKLALVGLVWQFLFSMVILYWEEGDIRLATIGRRFWLNNPISPRTGQKDNRLWWLLIPLMLLTAASDLALAPLLDGVWTNLFPFLAEPPSRSLTGMFAPEMHAIWIGAWNFFVLFMISSLFNNFLSEEFLFRGVLLPKMKGVFGKWDWVANGFLFGVYHLHMPWGIPGNIVFGWLMAFVARRYRSNWFPIALHNGQALYFGFLILGLVLGLA